MHIHSRAHVRLGERNSAGCGVGVQITHHRGGVDSRLEPPVPGLPLVRLDVTAVIGRVHLRHPPEGRSPAVPDRRRRWPGPRGR